MSNDIRFHFDPDRKIVIKTYKGVITLDDIRNSWEEAINNKQIPRDVSGYVLDYRQGHFDLKADEYIKIRDYYCSRMKYFDKKKIAIITDDPDDIVIPMLLEKIHERFEIHPFSTVEAAVAWLKNSSD